MYFLGRIILVDEEVKQVLADNLIFLRNIKGLTQEQVAEVIGISRQSYSKWEQGETYPDIDKCDKLAKYYGVTIDSLVHQDNKVDDIKIAPAPIDYTEEMLETDIENELVKNVTSLLMELGTGFAFMGQQYHLEVGGKDFYIDLLFYNTKLRCYVAIDLKTGEFKPEQAGKMNFYLSALDDLVKAPEDNPSVGLILCRDENRTIAEYALRDMSKPIGVSEYHLCTDLPLDLKNALPAVEDIRSRIDMKK